MYIAWAFSHPFPLLYVLFFAFVGCFWCSFYIQRLPVIVYYVFMCTWEGLDLVRIQHKRSIGQLCASKCATGLEIMHEFADFRQKMSNEGFFLPSLNQERANVQENWSKYQSNHRFLMNENDDWKNTRIWIFIWSYSVFNFWKISQFRAPKESLEHLVSPSCKNHNFNCQ